MHIVQGSKPRLLVHARGGLRGEGQGVSFLNDKCWC